MNYLIQQGDTLYEISKKYGISLNDILKSNPNINPYNLIIGTYIYLPTINNFKKDIRLKEKMREIWEQHVFWTRLLIVSIIDRLNDEHETTSRLLRNANDMADLYRTYYGNEVASIIAKLMNEHLVIAANLVHAIISNNTNEVNNLNASWYKNADEIASSLNSINPNYDQATLRQMLYTHLDLTKEEVTNRINLNYKKEIEVFDEVEKEALMMADYFTEGIYKQFN